MITKCYFFSKQSFGYYC